MKKFNDELYHYGILGMKWGVRRTPEQLGHTTSSNSKKENRVKTKIDEAKKKAESMAKKQADKKRKEILNDPSKLYKHRKEFSKEEIDTAMKQFEWEKKLKQLSVDDVRLGQEKMAKYLAIAGSVVGAYNIGASIYNAFKYEDDKELPYIKQQEKKKDKN